MGDNDVVGSNKGLSAMSGQEMGARNKRKYLTDMLFDVPLDESRPSLTEFPRYELLEEKLQNTLRMALEARSNPLIGEVEIDESEDAQWNDPLICEMQEILSQNLLGCFQSAIKRIIECGYDEKTAELLVLRAGLLHGSKDVVSNIVDGALQFAKRTDISESPGHLIFDDFQNLVEYTMAEMICVLREMKPQLTVAEAMWCLLICDLDLLHACTVKGECLDGLCGEIPEEISSGSKNAQSTPEASETSRTISNEINTSKPSDPRARSSQSEIPKVGQASPRSNSRDPRVFAIRKSDKEGLITRPGRDHVQPSAQTPVVEEKSGSRKLSVNSKRDILRQKTFHLEKSYKGRMSKGALKAKFSALGNMVLDKTMRSSSAGSCGTVMKSTSSNITASLGANGSLSEEVHHEKSNSTIPQSGIDSPGMLPMKESISASPAVNTEAPPPLVVETEGKVPSSSITPDCADASIPFEETLANYDLQDEKDGAILFLVLHTRRLKKELQSWTDWANEKIMQATGRLNKDKAELKLLRQEKEDAEKYKREKEALEESSNKRLSEMQHAWSNANSQIDFANATLRRLEVENSKLRQEVEHANLQAIGSALSLQEARQREQEAQKNFQSWSLKKSLMQEELTRQKRDAADLKGQVEKAEGRLKQIEALWKKEEKERLEASSKATSMREKRELQEALLKAEEDAIRQKSESAVQKCKQDIKKLEAEIAALKFESESERIAALRSGIGIGNRIASRFFGLHPPVGNKRLEVFRNNFGEKSTNNQERECVMCLTEEMSVVFLPCAHQVLCTDCNVLHEKQGMNECPSCRTLIERRIQARPARG